jgi:hypothetical protein
MNLVSPQSIGVTKGSKSTCMYTVALLKGVKTTCVYTVTYLKVRYCICTLQDESLFFAQH